MASNQQTRAREYVIFDLDNCLSDDGWRIPLIDWEAPTIDQRYHRYHSSAKEDQVGNLSRFRWETRETVTPIFLTARPLAYRALTEVWLRRSLITPPYTLIMRNNNDHRPSVEVKDQMVTWLELHYDVPARKIRAAFDDRPEIVEMYRSRGIRAEVLQIHNLCAMNPQQQGVSK